MTTQVSRLGIAYNLILILLLRWDRWVLRGDTLLYFKKENLPAFKSQVKTHLTSFGAKESTLI